MTKSFKKTIRLGRQRPDWLSAHSLRGFNTYARIEYEVRDRKGRLSITGVQGPLNNGNARGSCGQIDSTVRSELSTFLEYGPGIKDKAGLVAFLEIWDKWHLNDMRACCEHMRAQGVPAMAREKVTIRTYELSRENRDTRRELERESKAQLLKGESVQYSPAQVTLMNMPHEVTTYESDVVPAGYTLATDILRNRAPKIETKTRGWISYKDSPEFGLLGAPCAAPDCESTYGGAWFYEPVPAPVLAYLKNLPETDIQPAWV